MKSANLIERSQKLLHRSQNLLSQAQSLRAYSASLNQEQLKSVLLANKIMLNSDGLKLVLRKQDSSRRSQ